MLKEQIRTFIKVAQAHELEQLKEEIKEELKRRKKKSLTSNEIEIKL